MHSFFIEKNELKSQNFEQISQDIELWSQEFDQMIAINLINIGEEKINNFGVFVTPSTSYLNLVTLSLFKYFY